MIKHKYCKHKPYTLLFNTCICRNSSRFVSRTGDTCAGLCRLCLFLVLTANLALERLLAAYFISAETPLQAYTAQQTGVSGRM